MFPYPLDCYCFNCSEPRLIEANLIRLLLNIPYSYAQANDSRQVRVVYRTMDWKRTTEKQRKSKVLLCDVNSDQMEDDE